MKSDRLRIALLSPAWLRTPPRRYGAVEALACVLADGLTQRGHKVTLYASGDSVTAAELRSHYPQALLDSGRGDDPMLELMHVLKAYGELDEFDVIHDHSDAIGIALGSVAARLKPVVHTMHAPPTSKWYGPIYETVDDRIDLVAISESQRGSAPGISFTEMIHNGIEVERFPYRSDKDDYVFFIGRMSRIKGLDLAITAARESGHRLVVASKEVATEKEHRYFEDIVRPLLGPDVELVGEADFATKVALYARAKCTVVPTNWNEPFGLTAVESLACGTPVVGLRRGATAEIVEPGVTGFLSDDPAGLGPLIRRTTEIDPAACRRAAAERFSHTLMIERYERLYETVLARRG
ncbi:glycosyltransferase family 4 protein [Embleya sp. NPDC001921]